jgi:hypothetical protein
LFSPRRNHAAHFSSDKGKRRAMPQAPVLRREWARPAFISAISNGILPIHEAAVHMRAEKRRLTLARRVRPT